MSVCIKTRVCDKGGESIPGNRRVCDKCGESIPGNRILSNKRGESIVEAAIVIPVVILMILSMIILLLHFHKSMNAQTELHEKLSGKAMKNDLIFSVENDSQNIETALKGISGGVLKREISGKCYMLNPADSIRLKKGFGTRKER